MLNQAIRFTGKPAFLLLTTLSFILVACSPTEKALNEGQYDQVIHNLTAELQKKPSAKKVEQLQVAYEKANERDMAAINTLKSSGRPEIWYDVYMLFHALETRQQKVSELPEELLLQMKFEPVEYRNQLSQSRLKAAEYYYALVMKKMEDGKGYEDPRVYSYLVKIEEVYPGFRDAAELAAAWRDAQPKCVRTNIENGYNSPLPPGVAGGLEKIDPGMFSTDEIRFTSKKSSSRCGYFAEIIITDIKIKPEKTGELSYTESVKIQDGVAYQLDSDGNFVYDSLGQKIEIPKFNTLVCYVTEYRQEKSILMLGTLKLFDSKTGKMIGTEKLRGESVFTHKYAKFKGDMDALSAETFKMVGSKKRDFPTDSNMILHAGEQLTGDAALNAIKMLEKVEL